MVPILIVDDAKEDLVFAQRVFSANKVLNPVHLLSSGKACLEYFVGKGSVALPQLPCIVLLDMVMKPIGGLEVLRRLKNIPASKGSIIIMLSGLADIKKIAEGYRLGASTFLVKPLVSAELVQMLTAVHGLVINRIRGGIALSVTGVHGAASILQPKTQRTNLA